MYNYYMKTTRERILEVFHSRRVATASELSRILHLTTANIRHHLSILTYEGVVEVAGLRPTRGRGRPNQLFKLTQDATQHNLNNLAGSLLDEVSNSLSTPEYRVFLHRIASRLIQESLARDTIPSRRMIQAIGMLNGMNYQARWEAHAGSPHVILGHCPYAPILAQHPELCHLDAFLLQEMLGSPVTQTAKLKPDLQGLPQCIFVMSKTDSAENS